MHSAESSNCLRILLTQLICTNDLNSNFQKTKSLIVKAQAEASKVAPIDLICLPENGLYMRIKEGEALPRMKLNDEIFGSWSRLAIELKTTIHLGSVPLEINQKLYNCSIWVHKDGRLVPSYKKIHLFDIALKGQAPIRESDVFARGEEPKIQTLQNWSFGESICYDLRFSSLYKHYAQKEVDALLIPSAFIVPTGRAHWEILLRARAIESQCYVIASAQGGVHRDSEGNKRETYGHAMVIGPWGDKLAEIETIDDFDCRVVDIYKEKNQHVRTQIPMKNHRVELAVNKVTKVN